MSFSRSLTVQTILFFIEVSSDTSWVGFLMTRLYIISYPPDSQESDGGVIHKGKQLPGPASGDAKILLSY